MLYSEREGTDRLARGRLGDRGLGVGGGPVAAREAKRPAKRGSPLGRADDGSFL